MGLMQLMVRLGLDATGYETGLKKAQSSARGFGHELKSEVGGKIAGVFGAVAFEEGIRRTAEWAEKMKNLSSRTGIPLEEMQKFDFIAQTTGTDVMKLVKAFEAVGIAQAKAVGGDDAARSGLQGLGLSDEQINDLSKTKENFYTIADGIKGIDDASLDNVLLSFDKLGKGGKAFRDLLPALREGLDGAASGFVPMANETLENMAKLNKAFETAGQGAHLFFGAVASGWIQLGQFSAGMFGAIKEHGFSTSLGDLLDGGSDFITKQQGIDAQFEATDKRTTETLRRTGESLAQWKAMNADLAAVDKAKSANIAALNLNTDTLQEQKRIGAMTPEQRKAELQKEIEDLKTELYRAGDGDFWMTPIERAKNRNKLAKDELELQGMKDPKTQQQEQYTVLNGSHDSLLSAGNYLGTNANGLIADRVDVIQKTLQTIAKNTTPSPGGNDFPSS